MSKYVSAHNNARRIEEPKKKKYISAHSGAERNKGGVIEGAGYVAGNLGLGLAGVVEGVTDVAAAGGHLIRGDVQMAKQPFLDNQTAQAQQDLTEWYNPGKGMQFAGDVASGIGNSLTFMVPYVGPYLAAAGYLGMGISGAAEKTGDVGLKEIGYGAANAGMEFVMDKFVGGAGQAGKSIMSSLTRKGAATAGKATAKMAGKGATAYMLREIGKGALGEFAEESSTEAVDPLLQRLFGIDKNASTTIRDVAYAGLVGALSGGLMTAGPAAINFESARKTGKAIREGGEVEQMLHTAEMLIKGSERAQTKAKETKASEKADKAASTADKIKGAATGVVGGIKRGRAASAAGEMADKLRRNVTAYRQMMADPAKATTDAADALLGELRGNMYLAQVAYQMETYEAVLMNAEPEQKQQIVDVINAEAAKRGAKRSDYTVADLENNVDDILTSTAGRAVLESMMREMAGETAKAPQSPAEPAQAPKDTTAEQVNAQEQNADTEDLSGIEEEVWRAVTDETVKGYGTQNEQEVALLRAAVTHGVPEKSIPLMLERFREGTDMKPAEFADAWADGVLFFGRLGLNEEKISQESALSRMSEKARRASIEYGKWLSEEQRSKEQEAAKKKKRPVKEGESRKPKGEVVRHPGINLKADLDDAQFTAYKAAEIMAPALKADIEIHKGLEREGKQVNGYYDKKTNTLHINIDAVRDGKHIALYTLGHEVAHYIKAWSPKKFYELGDYVMEQLGEGAEQAIRDKLDFLKRNGLVKGLDETEAHDRAYEEVVADGMELVLTDGTVLDALARENKTLWQKIKDRIFEIIEKIKKAYGDLSKTSRTAQILSETMDSLEDIEQLFYEGVREAGERTRTAGVESVTSMNEGEMVYSSNGQYDFTKPFYEQVDDYQKGVFPIGDSLFLGGTPDVFIKIGFNALPLTINQTHIDYALNGTKNADHQIGEVLLKYLPSALKNPVAIITSKTATGTSVVAILSITHNGKQINVPVYIDGFGYQNGIMIDSNAITSAYARGNAITSLLKDAVDDEVSKGFGVLYWDKKRAIALLSNGKVTMPNILNTLNDGFLHSIRENASPVKPKYENVTESQQFKRWFGDWKNHPSVASKVVNADGTPKILYHQTAEDFTVFDPKHTGAGTTDFETPFGIFMKPTDSDIGLKGQKQMVLYANIRKPLEANDRADLVEKLKSLSPKYAELLKEMKSMNEEYKSKIDDAFNAWLPFVEEYRKTHPQVSRREILLDAEAKKVYDEPQRLTEEWTQKVDALAVKCKEEINKTLKAHGYDGVHIREDAGSGGRSTETYIALDPEQVKSATDNIGTFDATNPDIRYSIEETPENADVSGNPFDTDGKIEAYRKAFEEQGIKTILDAEKRAKAAERSAERAAERSVAAIYKARRDATDYKRAVYRTAYEKAEEKNRAYRERTDRKADESRERKEMTARKRTIMRVLGTLQTKITRPTKTNHVPKELHDLVKKLLRTADPEAWDTNRKNIREMGDLSADIEKLERQATRTGAEQERLDRMKAKYEHLEAETIPLAKQAEALYLAFKEYNAGLPKAIREDPDIMEMLESQVGKIENVPLKEMGLESLKTVEKIVTVVGTRVNRVNELFIHDRGEQVSDWGNAASKEAAESKPLKWLSPKSMEIKNARDVRDFLWKNMKPLTVFEAIGSPKLMELFHSVLDGEEVWITDILEAREVILKAKERYKYDTWDLKTRHEFTNAEGKVVRLTVGEMMSLYAYAKREQAMGHLRGGGFVLDAGATEITEKHKVRTNRRMNLTERYTMTEEDMGKLAGMLTEEQKRYADEMQDYLTSLGAKGNEISQKLYGLDLFNEKHYFPIKVKSEYLESQTGKTGDPKIKNRGMAKETKPDAKNPLVLQDFMDIFNGHVNDMATYHAFVLPVEDLTRVLNYQPSNAIIDENGNWTEDKERKEYSTLKAVIESKYGAQANAYIEQLIRDLNGGARREAAANLIDKGITAFKRASTMASLSVLVQQPTSLFRAMAYVDPKYFRSMAALDIKGHKEAWEQVKKYAKVAAIKEMGGYDTGVGTRTADYLSSKEYKTWGDKAKAFFLPDVYGGDSNYRAEIFGKGAAYADELAWIQMFDACKREQAEKLGEPMDSEEVLEAAGKRFTEVVRRTQVYDATLARSEYMRSKDTGMKMATAFMAEPTTVVSMVMDGLIRSNRGDKAFFKKTAGAIAASVIFNALAVSLVYAARDDDEEKTFTEKYLATLATETAEGFNPLEYLPYTRDIMSLMKGYDIERTDMALFADLFKSFERITSSTRTPAEKTAEVAGAVGAFFGVPIRNLVRDAMMPVNLVQGAMSGERTTGKGISAAMADEFSLITNLFGADTTNANQLYKAAKSGDEAHYNRVASRYKSEQAAEMALRTALRENDKRIAEAAEAKISGELEAYESIVEQIESEGRFDRNMIIRAINNEVLDIKDSAEQVTAPVADAVDEDKDTAESLYNASDLNDALSRGDREDFADIFYYLLATKQEQGKTEAQAKAAVKSGITSYWKKQYLAAWDENNTAEMKRILELLEGTELYGEYNDVATMAQRWIQES